MAKSRSTTEIFHHNFGSVVHGVALRVVKHGILPDQHHFLLEGTRRIVKSTGQSLLYGHQIHRSLHDVEVIGNVERNRINRVHKNFGIFMLNHLLEYPLAISKSLCIFTADFEAQWCATRAVGATRTSKHLGVR